MQKNLDKLRGIFSSCFARSEVILVVVVDGEETRHEYARQQLECALGGVTLAQRSRTFKLPVPFVVTNFKCSFPVHGAIDENWSVRLQREWPPWSLLKNSCKRHQQL